MPVTRLCTYIETLFTDIGYIFTNVSNGCDKNLNQGIDKDVTDIIYVFTHVTAIAYTICK